MPILTGNADIKLMCSDHKVAKIYCQNDVIYSSGNIVTYIVDGSVYRTLELDEGSNVLTAVPNPSKPMYAFSGWSKTNGGNALSSLTMGDDPITLYATWTGTPTILSSLNKSFSLPSTDDLEGDYRTTSIFLGNLPKTGSLSGHIVFNVINTRDWMHIKTVDIQVGSATFRAMTDYYFYDNGTTVNVNLSGITASTDVNVIIKYAAEYVKYLSINFDNAKVT